MHAFLPTTPMVPAAPEVGFVMESESAFCALEPTSRAAHSYPIHATALLALQTRSVCPYQLPRALVVFAMKATSVIKEIASNSLTASCPPTPALSTRAPTTTAQWLMSTNRLRV